MMSIQEFVFDCDALGHWFYVSSQGVRHEQVSVVRAFPVVAPNEGVALLDVEGHELLWITYLEQLSVELRNKIEQALRQREFMPCILRLLSVSSVVTPCVWQIETDRGNTTLLLNGEEDIRRLSGKALLVTDGYGVQFLIRELAQMDKQSRKLLDWFL
jgi:hypothetical protein